MDAILRYFTQHRIAPNAMMFAVLIVGLVALDRLQTQFIPDFELDVVQVTTTWRGAGSQEIQENVTKPLEAQLLGESFVDSLSAVSQAGVSVLTVTVDDQVMPLDQAVADIERLLAGARLPADADQPKVNALQIPEPFAEFLVYGQLTAAELERLANDVEDSLRQTGFSQIQVNGLPESYIAIDLQRSSFLALNTSIDQIAAQISAANRNQPIGSSELQNSSTRLSIAAQSDQIDVLAALPIRLNNGAVVRLDQIASLSLLYADNSPQYRYQDQPAFQVVLTRAKSDDTLALANELLAWVEQSESVLAGAADIWLYSENYRYVESRIGIILDNGLGGMILVLLVLLVFLNHRLSFWVAAGIPVSFLATFVFMELNDISVNLISLFGFLIALGIIVDDAIVVAENAYANLEAGDDPETAAFKAAKKMLPAVIASSITTIAAFLPLLLVGGPAGTFTKSVPLVVIMAISASLIECFLILPGHLAHSFKKGKRQQDNKFRSAVNRGVEFIKQRGFRPVVRFAVTYRKVTYAFALVSFALALSLVISGRVKFVFFPAIESPEIEFQVEFSQGTEPAAISRYLNELQQKVEQVNAEQSTGFLKGVIQSQNEGAAQKANLRLILDDSTERQFSNGDIVALLQNEVALPVGLVSLQIVEVQQGPSIGGIQLKLSAASVDDLLAATEATTLALRDYGLLKEVSSDFNSGDNAIDILPSASASLYGLDASALSSQLLGLGDERIIQTLQLERGELELRLGLETLDTQSGISIESLPIRLNSGEIIGLAAAADLRVGSEITRLQRLDGRLTAQIRAELANDSLSANEVSAQLEQDLLADLRQNFPLVDFSLGGDQESQADFLKDVQIGMVVGLLLIFGTLAWVFNSWSWPMAVMTVIPFGLTGAILGHWAMGLPLSALSIYGLFGLSGIVINDSIVLISFYRELINKGMSVAEAIEEAAVQRFRAVMLTSMTTVGGLAPLLLEKSFDAQFLLPMAAGLVFGLAFATLLILLLVPALLTSIETRREKRVLKRQQKQQKNAELELAEA